MFQAAVRHGAFHALSMFDSILGILKHGIGPKEQRIESWTRRRAGVIRGRFPKPGVVEASAERGGKRRRRRRHAVSVAFVLLARRRARKKET
jgi:hypothetical protein